MRIDLTSTKKIYSSFSSVPRDVESILKALFIEARPYSDYLKRLLIINTPDCLDLGNEDYQKTIESFSLQKMMEEGYIRLSPKIARTTFDTIKSCIYISFDNFTPNKASDHYRDYVINFDIICYDDEWVLDDYGIRPLMIASFIDGILNSVTDDAAKTRDFAASLKLTGIGKYQFLGCNEHVLNEDISMYTLSYLGVHFSEDMQEIDKFTNVDQ